MRRLMFMRSTLLFTTALVLAACGDDDGTGPGDDQIGSMTVTVTGDVSETFSGMAFYSETEGAWGIFLGDEAEDDSGIWFTAEGTQPGTGTLVIDAETDLGAFYVHGPSGNVYFAEEGVLNISTSTASRVAGSFEFTGVDFDGAAVNVEGTFNAPNIDEL